MKRYCLIFLACLIGAPSIAQELPVAAPRSLSCSFVQTRKVSMLEDAVVSEGTLEFLKPDKIRWEYTAPFRNIFIFNNGKAKSVSDGREQKLDLKYNPMMRVIYSIMSDGLNGAVFSDGSDFTSSMKSSENESIVELVPVKKDIGRIFSRIVLHVRKRDGLVNRIELHEPGGDSTDIVMHDIRTDVCLDEKIFNAD